jgi:nucleoside-diphosphate-sugar epimerase
LEADGYQVVALDDFSSASFKNLIEYRQDVTTLDVSDRGDADRSTTSAVDIIFHQASIRIPPCSTSGR